MKIETIEEWKLRTNKEPRKVDFSQAYKKCEVKHIDWHKYKKKSEVQRQKERDAISMLFKP